MVAGLLLSYISGTAWYMYAYNTSLWATLVTCVFPFVIFDIVKVIIVALIGPMIRKRLSAYLH